MVAFGGLVLCLALQGDPAAVVRTALAAVEGDSTTAVRGRWSRALRDDSADRVAALGLATLARLTYDDPAAERGYRWLLGDGAGPPPRDPVTAQATLGLGLLWRGQGDFRRADSVLGAAARRALEARDSALAAEALIRVASVRNRVRGPAAAEATLDTAARLIPAGDRLLQALHRCARAETLTMSSQRGARGVAEEGARLASEAGAGRIRAACLHFVAVLQVRQGAVDSALGTYAVVVAERRRTRDRAGLAGALQWRGYLYRTIGWLGHARRDLDEAAAESEATNPSVLPWVESNRAAIALASGDWETGRAYASRATSLFSAQGDVFGAITSLDLQGWLAIQTGDFEAAQRAYEDVVDRSRAFGQPESEIDAHLTLGQLAERRGEWGAAARELARAEATARRHGMPGYARPLLYHRGVLALRRGNLADAERLLRTHLAGVVSEQPNWRYQSGARLAEVLARRGRIPEAEQALTTADDALDAWRSTLGDRQLRLLAAQSRENDTDPDLGVATVLAALAGRGRVAASFALAERGRARDLADRLNRAAAFDPSTADSAARAAPAVTIPVVTASLPDSATVLLEYVAGVGDEPTTLFAITRTGTHAWILPPEDSLAPLIARFQVLLESDAAPRDLARALAAALLDSAVAALGPEVRRLVISPDGVLQRLPFDALLLADGSFVLERFAVTLTPSATVAVKLWRRPRSVGARGMLVMADPTFAGEVPGGRDDADRFRSAARGRGTLPRLPGSAREGRLVARYSPYATLLRRAAATETWLKHAPLTSYAVIHFASHALVDEGSLLSTALALTPGGGEDGFVGPSELAGLALAADLVVLSACRTAGGALVRGEGVQGLAAPLLEAGARAVVETWWPIGDAATVKLVGDFYEELALGLPAADALRGAKLAAMRRGAPAREWAAFTIIGDPLARPPLRPPPPGPSTALIAVAILGIALLGYGVWKRTRRAVERT
jgi:tetratricopeptide (TPR) repeat protein